MQPDQPRCANPECGHTREKHGGGNRCWAVVPLGSLCPCEAWQEPSVPPTANEVPTSANVAVRTQHGHWYDGMPGVWASDVDADGYCEQCRPAPTDGDLTPESEALLADLRERWPERGRRAMRNTVARALPAIESAARRTALTDSPSPDDAPSVVDQSARYDRLHSLLVDIAEEGWPSARKSVAIVCEETVPAIERAALESRVEPVADLIHEACVADWERRASRHPGRALTLHGPDAHVGAARVVLGLEVGT